VFYRVVTTVLASTTSAEEERKRQFTPVVDSERDMKDASPPAWSNFLPMKNNAVKTKVAYSTTTANLVLFWKVLYCKLLQ